MWNINETKYELTDEYFCNLIVYNKPIQDFYKFYAPINKEKLAFVYLYPLNYKTQKLNNLQDKSTNIIDKNKEKDCKGNNETED